jgi:hypothetical protein
MRKARNVVDEALDELHEVRLQIAARFDDDPAKLIAHLQEYHRQLLLEGWVEAPPRDVRDTPAV